MSISAVPAAKAALVTALQGMFPAPVLVSYGLPGSYQPDVIVAVMDARIAIERPVMSPGRPREEVSEIDVLLSVWRAGTESVQQAATEQAFSMLGTFADYFKTSPNEKLGVASIRESWVSGYELGEAESLDPNSGAPTGRVAEIRAVVTVKARI